MNSFASPASRPRGSVEIGRDLWPVGRLIRLLAGLLLLASVVEGILGGQLGAPLWRVSAEVVLAGAAIAIIYIVAVALLGDRVLARLDPWAAAIVLLAPAAALYVPSVPGWAIVGFILYVGASMIAQAGLNYGGCEVAAVPLLVARRRYTIYCALNSVDAAERALRGRSKVVAAAVAVVVFILVSAIQILIEQAGGRTSTYLPAYVIFLIVGFVVSKIRARMRAASGDGGPTTTTTEGD